MPRPRYEKLSPERRHAIMEAAAKELGANGYEGSSLNRILEQANLSKGAAYYYFDGKEDLIATMFNYLWDRMIIHTELKVEAMTAENFWEKLQSFVTHFVASTKDEPWLMAAAKAIWGLPHEIRSSQGPLGQAFTEMGSWMTGFLRRGQELGVIRNDLPTDLLLAMVLGMDEATDRWVYEHFDDLGEAEMARLYGVVFAMWRRLLSPEAP